jgi:N-acetyl-gamma-glutamyl-phosphate reductase
MIAGELTVGVVGASGYAGGEVLRVLAGHPRLRVAVATAHRKQGQRVAEAMPHLAAHPDYRDLVFAPSEAASVLGCDVVVTALPHGASAAVIAEIEAQSPGTVIVDAGADYRLEDADDWADYYRSEHSGATFPYGLPELLVAGSATGKQRDRLVGATRIAAPGCNASTVSLAFAPLVAHGLVDPAGLTAVLPVGTTGAGRSPKEHLLASQIDGSANPYGVGGTHRHIPEVLQNLRAAGGGDDLRLAFTPILVPMNRGILAVCQAPAADGVTAAGVRDAFRAAYDDEPFVTVLPDGAYPRTGDLAGSNVCQIGATVDGRSGQVIVIAALDNLVKGTAGAAVQSLNIALGLPETEGLPLIGAAP